MLRAKPQPERGLSLFFTRNGAKRLQRPIYGFLALAVGHIEAIMYKDERLNVVRDDELHAEIIGLPNPKTVKDLEQQKILKKEAIRLAGELAAIATIDLYSDIGMDPKTLQPVTLP